MAIKWEIRLYDETGERQPLPRKFILGWDFELLERGGYGTFSLSLDAELDDQVIPAIPEPGWRIDWFFNGIPAYRGWVERPKGSIAVGRQPFKIEGSGLMTRVSSILADCVWAKAHGASVGEVFGWLTQKFLAGDSERLGDLVSYIEDGIGQTVERVDMFGQSVRQAFDSLASAAEDTIIWGFDVTTAGSDRLYVRTRPSSVLREDYRLRIGKDIEHLDGPEDMADLVNSVRLVGGKAKAPNLTFNGSFELPVPPGDGPEGNLIRDSSFESAVAGSPWTYDETAGAVRQDSNGEAGEYARTGDHLAQLDDSTDSVLQRTKTLAAAGANQEYLVVLYHAIEDPGTGKIAVRVRELDSSNNPVGTANPLIDDTIDEADSGGKGGIITATQRTYKRWSRLIRTTHASTAKLDIRIKRPASPGNGVLLDDVWVFEDNELVQEGWQKVQLGTGAADIDWANQEDPYHGVYCVRVDMRGGDGTAANSTRIRPTKEHWSDVLDKTQYVVKIRMRVAASQTLDFRIGLQRSGDGSDYNWSTVKTTAGTGDWEEFTVTLASGTKTRIRPVIEFRENGVYYVDGVQLYESGVDTEGGQFIDGENVNYTFRTDVGWRQITDLETHATILNQVKSVASPFTSADIGKTVRINNVTGWLPGDYKIGSLSGAYAVLDTVAADAAATSGTATVSILVGLSTEAQTSIATYGLREAILNVEEITDEAAARTWIAGYFNRYAVPAKSGKVTVEPCDTHFKFVGEDVLATTLGQIAVSGAKIAINNQNPTRIVYSMDKSGNLRCEMDLTNRRGDPALLLKQDADRNGGGGSSSGGGSNLTPRPGNSGNNGDEGIAPTWQVNGADVGTRSRLDIQQGVFTTADGTDVEADDKVIVVVDVDVDGVLNARGVIADIPASDPDYAGRTYFATDVNSGTLYRDNGTVWEQVAPGVSEAGASASARVPLGVWGKADISILTGTPDELYNTWTKRADDVIARTMSGNGVITHLIVDMHVAISGAGTVTFEVYVNGVGTGMTLAMASGDGAHKKVSGSVAFNEDDLVTVFASRSGTVSNAPSASCAVEGRFTT